MNAQNIKPKVGFYGVTGCAGCLLSVVFNEDEILDIISKLDIVSFPLIKGKNSDEPLDICFIEGVVTSTDDLEVVKNLRDRSKVVVAIGSCACSGCIPALRNFCDEKNLDYLKYEKNDQLKDLGVPSPISKYVKVDFMIPGCPPDRDEIKRFIKETVLGKKFRSCPDPVCRECKLFENYCLLDDNKMCLGPLITGGCHAICPSRGFICYGCRGITDDAKLEEYFSLLISKGFDPTEIKKHLETFIALEVNVRLKGSKWETLH